MKTAFALLLLAISNHLVCAQTNRFTTIRTNIIAIDRARNRVTVPVAGHLASDAMLKDGATFKPAPNVLARSPVATNLDLELNKVYLLPQKGPDSLPAGRSVTNRLLH